ncbi:hypothetical protein [Methylobacter sp.]
MTPITMMNADNSRKILLNHNYQRHLRSIFNSYAVIYMGLSFDARNVAQLAPSKGL